MTSITDTTRNNEDNGKWATLQTVIFVSGIAYALWSAGANFGNIKDIGTKLEAHQRYSERIYVRKDGGEIAELKTLMQAMNEKLDDLKHQRTR